MWLLYLANTISVTIFALSYHLRGGDNDNRNEQIKIFRIRCEVPPHQGWQNTLIYFVCILKVFADKKIERYYYFVLFYFRVFKKRGLVMPKLTIFCISSDWGWFWSFFLSNAGLFKQVLFNTFLNICNIRLKRFLSFQMAIFDTKWV